MRSVSAIIGTNLEISARSPRFTASAIAPLWVAKVADRIEISSESVMLHQHNQFLGGYGQVRRQKHNVISVSAV